MDKSYIKISFIGDIMCELEQLNGYELGNGNYNFKEVFSQLKEYFYQSNYIIGNL